MDPWALVAVALAFGLAVTAVANRRSRDRLRQVGLQAGVGREGDPLFGVSRLLERADALERRLAEERRTHELRLDLMDVGWVDLDGELRIVHANAAAHAFVGRARGTLVGLDTLEAFLDTEVEAIARAAVEHGSSSGEVRLRGPDDVTLAVHAQRSTGGGVWLLLADVSELRRLQQIRAEFIDNLSHELRTPLATVSLLAEALTRDAASVGDALPDRMRDRIARIEVETGHLAQMVSEIMDLSRIEAGGGLGPIDDVDLARLARGSAERLRLFAERQGVRLLVEADPDLPSIRGDETRLGQVFVNLVHNAVKFSPDGGDVTISVRRGDGELVASVEDHGVGVPRAAQARIFERFYKVDRSRARGQTGGTGLGLAIARHVVEQHSGRIWVDSTEGAGSRFSFALPLDAEGT